jgi:cytochrome bd-type quinol oxidase subunit 2
MIKKLKSIVLTLAAISVAALPTVVVPSVAFADASINGNLCSGTTFNIGSGGVGTTNDCGGATSTTNFNNLLVKIVNIFSAIVGVIAVIMIIVGGFRYITSGGDSNHVSSAKTTIIYALVGLVIVALAQLIVRFVLTQTQTVTGGGGGATVTP